MNAEVIHTCALWCSGKHSSKLQLHASVYSLTAPSCPSLCCLCLLAERDAMQHTYAGTSTFRITFEKTSVKTGDFNSTSPLPSISTPEIPEFLRPPSPARSGQFETTYLDKDFRVSRGDLGELRVFVRA